MIWVSGFILGLCLGSLTKLMADRSLTKQSFWGRSYCVGCKKQLKWYDLFPLFSYLFLRGKCRYCGFKLSIEYPLIEFLMGLLIAGVFVKFLPSDILTTVYPYEDYIVLGLNSLFYTVTVVTLTAVFLTDMKTGYIPDRITYPSIWTLFILLLATTATKIYFLYASFNSSSLGEYLLPPHSNYFYDISLRIAEPLYYGCLMAFLIGLFFYILIVLTKGKGMGGGDLKLGVFLGLAFGFPYSLVVLMLSFLLGALFGLGLIILRLKKFGQTIPFGPFLSLAGIITLFWGDKILAWYLSLRML